MSSSDHRDDAGESAATDRSGPVRTRDELRAELELLRERNQQLQDSYVQAHQTQYHRTAAGFALIGGLAVAGAVVFPGVREVLLVLGATGLFAALLTWYLTPERFVSATVGTAVYDALAEDRTVIADELGLSEARVYVAIGDANSRVRLFVPQFDDYDVPADEELDATHVVPGSESERGVAFRPTGEPLLRAFEDALSGTLGETPGELVSQLTDAVVEQFDLVTGTHVDFDNEGGRLTVGVSDSVYGPVDRFDHPVVSFVAVGLARGLGRPVTATVQEADDDRFEYQVTYRWDSE